MRLSNGPRERIEKYGIQSLTDQELIAILIKTGTKEKNVIKISEEIMDKIVSFSELNDYKYEELMQINGIGKVKAMTICAALELSNRVFKSKERKRSIESVYDEVIFLKGDFYNQNIEKLICIFLDNSMKIISKQIIQEGNYRSVFFDKKEILKRALRLNARAVITAHNHPSGESYPSEEDLIAFKELEERLTVFDIIMFDNLVFTDKTYISIKYNIEPKKIPK